MDASEVFRIIKQRQATLQVQRSSGPREDIGEATLLIASEYDALVAEIERALANQPEAERKNEKAEAEILGDQGQSGG